jgi:stearoyl-CoA desaturase (delta-9 desaturase)
MTWNGWWDLSFWGYAGVTLLLTHVTIASVTIFLHRHQAHRALTLHPAVSHFFRLWLWLTTGMVTREWVAIHRKHHARCETAEDPHSPQVYGIWRVLFGGVGLYRTEGKKTETLEVYGRHTPDDWLERHVYSQHRFSGLGITLVVDVLLFGWVGLAIFVVQMVWIPFWAAGVINGVGHYWGYRNFETQDTSRNIVPIGILIGGEEFHNNHHAYGSSAKLANKWWELDIGRRWRRRRLEREVRRQRGGDVHQRPPIDDSRHVRNGAHGDDDEQQAAVERQRERRRDRRSRNLWWLREHIWKYVSRIRAVSRPPPSRIGADLLVNRA